VQYIGFSRGCIRECLYLELINIFQPPYRGSLLELFLLSETGFAYRTPPNGSRRFALGHFKAPLQVPAQSAPPPPKPRGGRAALAGERSEPEGSVSVGHMHCSVESGSRAENWRRLRLFSRPVHGFESNPKNVIQFGPSGGHDLPKSLPQLQRRERAAHTGTVSERAFGKIGQNSRRNSKGFQS
jgi:hypothetical protein